MASHAAYHLIKEDRKRVADFPMADYARVGPDFVQMRPKAGYDFVRCMREALRVGDTR